MPNQLSLFDERLHQDLERTQRRLEEALEDNVCLRARLAQAKVAYRTLRDQQENAPCQACQAWHLRVEELSQRLLQAEEARDRERRWAELWKGLLDLHRQEQFQGGHPQAPGLSRDHLTALLKVAHPDKWSQGQPTTQLAHELSVAINQLRDRAAVEADGAGPGKSTGP